MTPREALDRITALDAEDIIRERSLAEGAQWLYAVQVAEVTLSVVRGVLAEVSPEPGGTTSDDHQRGYAQGYTEGRAAGWDEREALGGVLDRDQARAVIEECYVVGPYSPDVIVDRLAGCVVAKRSDDA